VSWLSAGPRVSWMCRSRGPAGSHPPRSEFGSGWVGRERTLSRVLSPPAEGVVIYLGRRFPGASSDRYPRAGRAASSPAGLTAGGAPCGERPPIWSCSTRGLPGRPVTRPPVGSYPTISPLPVSSRRTGGVISVALSFGSPRLGVTQRAALRSPDFPPRSSTERGDHPSASTRVDLTTWPGIRRWPGWPARRRRGSSRGERAGPPSHRSPGAAAAPWRGAAADRCS
jgi:hypothetical protein